MVAVEHVIQVVVPGACRLVRHVRLIRYDRLIRGQDLPLLCLACTHDLTPQQHLPLPVGSPWLALVLFLLSFKDDLLFFAHLNATILILNLLLLLGILGILLRVLHGFLLRFESS